MAIMVVFEFIFLPVVKIPLLSKQNKLMTEFNDMNRFYVDIVDTYCALIPSSTIDQFLNSTNIFLSKVNDLGLQSQKSSVLKYTLSKDLNEEFENPFQPGFGVKMNNSFLMQNYLYDLKKYSKGVLSLSEITIARHQFTMAKYKSRLLEFFRAAENQFLTAFENNSEEVLFQFTSVYFAWNGALMILVLVFNYSVISLLSKLLKMNSLILFTEDNSIVKIINYYGRVKMFLADHLKELKSPQLLTVMEAINNQSNLLVREKKRVWRGFTQKYRKTIFMLVILVWIFNINILCTALLRYFFESSLYKSNTKSQALGRAILDDFKGVSLAVMLAKDYFVLPESLSAVNSTIINATEQVLSTQLDPGSDKAAIEGIIGGLYSQDICDLVSSSPPYCKDVYNSILENNIKNVKLILKNKLGFIFTNASASAYNYTAADVQSLDAVKSILGDAFVQIFDTWNNEFSSVYSKSLMWLIVLASGYSSSIIFLYFVFVEVVIRRLERFYAHERNIFKNFMPAETLRKSKLARVRLAQDNVLKHR
jgi:hypothetical protein